MSSVSLGDAYALGGAEPRGVSTRYSIPLDGKPLSLGPFPFTARSVTILNQTGANIVVTDDRGEQYVAAPSTAPTYGVGPTMRMTAQLSGAQTSGKATVVVFDTAQPVTSAQLANLTPQVPTLKISKNGALVGTEAILDFLDASGFTWTIVDDAANTRVRVTPVPAAIATPLVDVVAGQALPLAPTDGLVVAYYPDKTNFPDALWLFRWNATAAHWQTIGAVELAQFDASGGFRQNTIAATWQNMPGFSVVTMGRAGKYRCTFGAEMYLITNPNDSVQMGISVNGATPVRPWISEFMPATIGSVGQFDVPAGSRNIDVVVTAGQTIALQLATAAPANVAVIGPELLIKPLYVT